MKKELALAATNTLDSRVVTRATGSREPILPRELGQPHSFEIKEIHEVTSSGPVLLAAGSARRDEAEKRAREAIAAGDAEIAAGNGRDITGTVRFITFMVSVFIATGVFFVYLVKTIPIVALP